MPSTAIRILDDDYREDSDVLQAIEDNENVIDNSSSAGSAGGIWLKNEDGARVATTPTDKELREAVIVRTQKVEDADENEVFEDGAGEDVPPSGSEEGDEALEEGAGGEGSEEGSEPPSGGTDVGDQYDDMPYPDLKAAAQAKNPDTAGNLSAEDYRVLLRS